jgi:hypothetical protein
LFFSGAPEPKSVYQFSVETGNWSPALRASKLAIEIGVEIVTDINTDLIYIGGADSARYQKTMDVWNWKTGQNSTLDLPTPEIVFESRKFYSAEWSKWRQSILLWGGQHAMIGVGNGLLSEYIPSTKMWSTVVSVLNV